MQLGVYGGSFNPPHVAHQLAAAYVLATEPIDELWVMPAPSHAFGKSLAPFEHRVEMTRLAMRHFGGRVRVSTLEEELPQPARTLDTFKAVLRQIPDATLALIIGADILPETPKWKGWAEIQALARVVVLGRRGYPTADSVVVLPEVSSTQVRGLLATGGACGHLLDRAVLDYAVKHRLYAQEDAS